MLIVRDQTEVLMRYHTGCLTQHPPRLTGGAAFAALLLQVYRTRERLSTVLVNVSVVTVKVGVHASAVLL